VKGHNVKVKGCEFKMTKLEERRARNYEDERKN